MTIQSVAAMLESAGVWNDALTGVVTGVTKVTFSSLYTCAEQCHVAQPKGIRYPEACSQGMQQRRVAGIMKSIDRDIKISKRRSPIVAQKHQHWAESQSGRERKLKPDIYL